MRFIKEERRSSAELRETLSHKMNRRNVNDNDCNLRFFPFVLFSNAPCFSGLFQTV